jgi:hypothetical protein
VKISIFDSVGQLVWESQTVLADGAKDIRFSSDPFYSDGAVSFVAISAGTAVFDWDGRNLAGDLAGTGDYRVKAEVTGVVGVLTYSRVLTLVIQKQNVVGGVALGPNPAKNFLVIDLSQLPPGIELDISVWNLGGDLVREFHAASGPQARILWDLNSPGGQAISSGVYVAMIRSAQNDSRLQDKRFFKFAVLRD